MCLLRCYPRAFWPRPSRNAMSSPPPFGADVKIESAKLVAATANLPEHCDVRGVIWPEAKFAVKLPTNWNNRFQMVGNGGWAGTISAHGYGRARRLRHHLHRHGPRRAEGTRRIFAYPSPNNPNAARKVIDHGYLAVHETALLAKKMIRAYYGSDPLYSYWVGCSTGGRQGLMEAQRYPEDFDGYVIGAPVLNLTGLQMKAVWNQIADRPRPGRDQARKTSRAGRRRLRKVRRARRTEGRADRESAEVRFRSGQGSGAVRRRCRRARTASPARRSRR